MKRSFFRFVLTAASVLCVQAAAFAVTAPPQPTQIQSCGSTLLDLPTATTNCTYYWQTSASGTSTTIASGDRTVTAAGTYYVRTYDAYLMAWSTATTVSVGSIKTAPAVPTVTAGFKCGPGTVALSASSATSGATINWYLGSTLQLAGENNFTTPSLSATTTYTTKAVKDGCLSNGTDVIATIKPSPAELASQLTLSTLATPNEFNLTQDMQASGVSSATYTWYTSADAVITTSPTYNPNSATGNVTFKVKALQNGCNSDFKSITSTRYATPPAPGVTQTQYCGYTRLSTTTVSGSTIYWQTTSSGVLTTNSASPYDVTTAGTYYLRAKDNSTGTWSGATTVSVAPIKPSTATLNSQLALSTLSSPNEFNQTQDMQANGVTGGTYTWYTNADAVITTAATYNPNNSMDGVTYKVKANYSGCTSDFKTITSTRYATPPAPGVTQTQYCGYTRLSPTTASGSTIYWQTTSSGVLTTNSASPYDVTTAGTYYLRAKDNTTGTWSGATTVSVAPIKPSTATLNSQLALSTLSSPNEFNQTQDMQANGVTGGTYTWYTNADVVITTAATYNPNSTVGNITYKVKAEVSSCYSDFKSINSTRYVIPPNPTQPTQVQSCGSTLLDLPVPPTNCTYYWQTAVGGSSTANGSGDKTVTNAGTYYVRTFNGAPDNSWSTGTTTVTVSSIKAVPVANAGADKSICAGDSWTLTASGGTTYSWSPATGLSAANIANPVATPTATTTYTMTVTTNGCSATDQVVVTVNTLSPPNIPPVSRVDAGVVNMTVSNPGNVINWYTQGGTSIINTGNSYSPNITQSTTYDVVRTDNVCTSSRSQAIANVTPLVFQPSVPSFPSAGTLAEPVPLSAEAGQQTLAMSCNSSWQVTSKPDWVTLDKTSGTGNDNINLTFPICINQLPNRTGSITVTAGTTGTKQIYFSQTSKTFAATLVPSEFANTVAGNPAVDISLSPASSSVEFAISTDITTGYQAEITDPSGDNWLYKCNVSESDHKAYLDYGTNRDVNTRSGTLTFKYGDIVMQQFEVEQKAVTAWSTGTFDRNYVQTTAYGENGRVLGQSVAYSDNLGKPVQSVARNMSREGLVVSQTLYDAFGRPEITTMPIPVAEQVLDEVLEFASPEAAGSTTFDPLCIALNYYSNNNTSEPFVPHDETPYSRVEYSTTIPGAVRKSFMAGDATKDRFSTAFTVSASPDEFAKLPLNNYVDMNTLKTLNEGPLDRSEFMGISKTVSRDVMGKESATYTNAQGQLVATCMSSSTATIMDNIKYTFPECGYIDIHLPAGQTSYTLTKSSSWGSKVIDLVEDTEVQTGTGSTIVLVPGFYRIILSRNEGTRWFTTSLGYKYHSFNAYDAAGRLMRSLSPKDVEEIVLRGSADLDNRVSRNTYNTLGWLLSSYSQDEGLTEYIYRRDGKIRFSQNAQQRNDNKFSYSNYDQHGRIAEVGEVESATAGANFNGNNPDTYVAGQIGLGISDATYYDRTFTLYDKADANGPGSPKFLRGKVSKTWNDNTATWYSYTYDGLVEWVVQEIKGMDTDNDGFVNDLNPTNGIEDADDLAYLDYTYDYNGNVTTVTYSSGISRLQPGLENPNQYARDYEFTHYYEYDLNDRLEAVYTQSKKDAKQLQSRYFYYPHGPLKRVELADKVQGTDYIYTIQGWLKGINYPNPGSNDPGKDGISGRNASIAVDAFGMTLDYYSGDYTRTGTNITSKALTNNFDGNIANQRWRNSSSLDNTKPGYLQNAYTYYYDERNYLARSNFSIYNASADAFGSGTAYCEYGLTAGSNITYDANGNIINLSRKGENGELIDALTYNYSAPGATAYNRLTSVTDASNYTLAGTQDLKTQSANNYQYNHIGQMTHNVKDGHYFTYDVYGKTKTIYNNISFAAGTELATYEYDDRGFRVKKIDHRDNTTTYYVRDASGNMIATYTKANTAPIQRTEVPVYGSGRLGMATCSATGAITAYTYELTDHLGNVRATLSKDVATGATQLLTATDYYPFGMEMLGRKYRSTNAYRFGYQGQFAEKDPETGYNQFEARLYDARIGRWLNPDPLRLGFSHYIAMGNNPIIAVDPDGRDIVIVVASGGGVAGSGHMAMLIGNDVTGWNFLSKEGTEGSMFRAIIGGPAKTPQLRIGEEGQGYYNSLDEFFNDKSISSNYDKAIRIQTDPNTDNVMFKEAQQQVEKGSPNHVLTNNCADAVSNTMVVGGLDPGYMTVYTHPDPMTSFTIEQKKLSPVPNIRLNYMYMNNAASLVNIFKKTPSTSAEMGDLIFNGAEY